jgi:DNA (cytosine-5)-methyltransferase 1
MSVANQKKNNETLRNSLVVRAIELIKKIKPKIFVFENVKAFMKTICVGMDGEKRTISKEIYKQLSDSYEYLSNVLNFKNYGSNSSRTRTLVCGVRKDCLNKILPFEVFPNFTNEKKLSDVIGEFKSLNIMGEFDKNNPLHSFKKYEPRMRK